MEAYEEGTKVHYGSKRSWWTNNKHLDQETDVPNKAGVMCIPLWIPLWAGQVNPWWLFLKSVGVYLPLTILSFDKILRSLVWHKMLSLCADCRVLV